MTEKQVKALIETMENFKRTLEDLSDSFKDFAREHLTNEKWTELVTELEELKKEHDGRQGN